MNRVWNQPYLLLILSTLFWGSNSVVGKFLIHDIPPITISLIRLSTSTLILLPFVVPLLKKDWNRVKANYTKILLLTVSGVVGFNLLGYWALEYTSAINFSLFNSTTPFFMTILAYFLMGDRLNPTMFLSMILSLLGVSWLITQGSMEVLLDLQFNKGDLIALSAVFMWAVYSIYIKKTVGIFHPLSLFVYCLIIGVLMLIPASIVERSSIPSIYIDHIQWIFLLYLGIFPSICSFLMWNRALVLIGPSKSSLFTNLIPIFGTMMAFVFLGEEVTIHHLIGAIFVFIGVFVGSFGNRKKKKALLSMHSHYRAR